MGVCGWMGVGEDVGVGVGGVGDGWLCVYGCLDGRGCVVRGEGGGLYVCIRVWVDVGVLLRVGCLGWVGKVGLGNICSNFHYCQQ